MMMAVVEFVVAVWVLYEHCEGMQEEKATQKSRVQESLLALLSWVVYSLLPLQLLLL